MDSARRTGIKVAIWSGMAFSITMLSAYIIDNTIDTSLQIATIDCIIKVVAHISYERIWQRIKWDRNVIPNV